MASRRRAYEGFHGRFHKTRKVTTFSTRSETTGEVGRMRAAEATLSTPIKVSNYDLEVQRGMVVSAVLAACRQHNLDDFYRRYHRRYPRAQMVFEGRAKIKGEASAVSYGVPSHVPSVNFTNFHDFVQYSVSDFFSALKKKEKYVIWFEAQKLSIRFYDHVRTPVPAYP